MLEKINDGEVRYNPFLIVQYGNLLDVMVDHALEYVFNVLGIYGKHGFPLHEVAGGFRDNHTDETSRIDERIVVMEKNVSDHIPQGEDASEFQFVIYDVPNSRVIRRGKSIYDFINRRPLVKNTATE